MSVFNIKGLFCVPRLVKFVIPAFIIVLVVTGVVGYFHKQEYNQVLAASDQRLAEAVAAKPAPPPKKPSFKIVFLGDSITAGGKWNTYFPSHYTMNHGIGGNMTADVLHRIEPVVQNMPDKLFIMVGVNDLSNGVVQKELLDNYAKILETVQLKSPRTKVYVESVLPINVSMREQMSGHKEKIPLLNSELEKLVEKMGYTYLDTYSVIAESGELPAKYTTDGLHLNDAGYGKIVPFLSQYVNE